MRRPLISSLLLVLGSCDAVEPPTVEPRSGPGPLDGGNSQTTPHLDECTTSLITDTILDLFSFWSGLVWNYIDDPNEPGTQIHISSCPEYARQIFTGVTTPDNSPVQLAGRGRAGHATADAILCTMRELSPELAGPITSTASINLGIGDVVARQEVGFVSFDTTEHAFTGYRRVELDMPVFGKFTASAQSIRLVERSVTTTDSSPSGAVGSITGYGLDLTSEEHSTDVALYPPGFDVETPIGIFEVAPFFEMHAQTRVIDSDFDGSTSFDIANWGGPGSTAHFQDIYGLLNGIAYASLDAPPPGRFVPPPSGWYSGMAFGTRTASPGTVPWAASGVGDRPNYDLAAPREEEEALPATHLSAGATVHYPEDPTELLPDWVLNLDGVRASAWIDLTARLSAGVGGQLAIATHEGTAASFNVATFEIDELSQVEAGFELEVVLHMNVTVETIFGPIELVDVDKTIPIPIAGDHVNSPQTVALGYSMGNASQLEAMTHLDGSVLVGQPATQDFIDECYAEEVPDETIPEWTPEPGDPSDLFSLGLQPCNICIAIDEQSYETEEGPVVIEQNLSALLLPSDGSPRWACDGQSKTGCMDMCVLDPNTGSFIVSMTPLDLASKAAQAGDAATAAFYAACMN